MGLEFVFRRMGDMDVTKYKLSDSNFIFMNMKQDIYKNLQEFLHSRKQFSRVFLNFRNFLPETKVFSSSVPQENPHKGRSNYFQNKYLSVG